jgi:hypothetical protein
MKIELSKGNAQNLSSYLRNTKDDVVIRLEKNLDGKPYIVASINTDGRFRDYVYIDKRD